MKLLKTIGYLLFFATLLTGAVLLVQGCNDNEQPKKQTGAVTFDSTWHAPDIAALDNSPESELIRYGRELIANTSYYLGPRGKVASLTNGMNCQNCHLDAGTRPWGNNYGGVYAMYPLYRERSGSIETIHKRVSDCIERSLNGAVPDSASKEMRAIETYIEWVGKNVPRKTKPYGAGIKELPYLDRAADSTKGKLVYITKCQRCHGINGEGLKNPGEGTYYTYPPLWGDNSYNTGAGLYRLSRFAGYAKANMPFDIKSDTALSVEEAWDVAAFVNSQPRPRKDFTQDWPNIAKKPIDHPFGPYADGFSEAQHKYGPFAPIKKWREAER
jgi:thiosulfate dehydrogenase